MARGNRDEISGGGEAEGSPRAAMIAGEPGRVPVRPGPSQAQGRPMPYTPPEQVAGPGNAGA